MAMAAAVRTRDGVSGSDFSGDELSLAEKVLCLVLTNAVEVTDRDGLPVGIAVYDWDFSWINHSCCPNACYRFYPAAGDAAQPRLITPGPSDGDRETGFSANSDLLKESWERRGGPMIVVRNIKPMKKGEEVTIAYTDLLQPKELRQSDLWSKYRFTCCCIRCDSVPLTHADLRLQEISVFETNSSDPNPSQMPCHDPGVEKCAEYVDDTIDDYLSSGDAESCCEKLENLLINGFRCQESDKELIIRLHPQHHLSFNAYTTLTSAYKVRAVDQNRSNSLKMIRFSVGYSFLLAILTHNLFRSESSLIASTAQFWVGSGESLLNVARSLVSVPAVELPSRKCSKCTLADTFEADFDHGLAPKTVLDVSEEFVSCIADITLKVWRFLGCKNSYLEVVEVPTNLLVDTYEGQERVDFFGLGVHCLLYGGVLSNVCGGQDSHLSRSVRRMLYDGQD